LNLAGSGTIILGIFAAKAGARHVYICVSAQIVFLAQRIVAENLLNDKIEILDDCEFELPEKVDIILADWPSQFLFQDTKKILNVFLS